MNIPFKINPREKKIILAGSIAVILIFMYLFSAWYSDARASTREYIEAKRITLDKQLNKIAGKATVQKRFENLKNNLEVLDSRLLSGDKPPVVAANIQRILKDLANNVGIDIKSEKALTPEENGLYLAIPVEIGFTANTDEIKKMLYRIKTSKSLLIISEMKIRVNNRRKPVNAHVNLSVKGFIKKPQLSVKGKKEGANAS